MQFFDVQRLLAQGSASQSYLVKFRKSTILLDCGLDLSSLQNFFPIKEVSLTQFDIRVTCGFQ
eukprot:3786484-Pyramimonas_sp.AAC.1